MRPVRFCPKCRAIFRRDVEHCALDGARLSSGEEDPWIGRTAGRYAIESLIGSGSMGRVYRATHPDLEATYAVKILYGDFAGDREMVARFRREAQTLGRLRHPNIVAVIDFGTTEGGLPYLVMEYVAGRSLRELISADGPLDPVRAIAIAAQIAAALAEAHEQGFVHRDLKPANVRVTPLKTGEHARVVDFGLVSALEVEGEELTQTGITFGTPAYMAPEQAESAAVGAAADLYSLGVILYEMISGRRPLEGSADTILRHKNTFPAPRLGRDDTLADLVARLLERDPALRPSAVAAWNELGTITLPKREGEATEQRIERAPRRRRGLLLLVALASVAIFVALGLQTWRQPSEVVRAPATAVVATSSTAEPKLRGVALRMIFLHDADPRDRVSCPLLLTADEADTARAELDDLFEPAGIHFYIGSTEYLHTPALAGSANVTWEQAVGELGETFPEMSSWVASGSKTPLEWLSIAAACGGHPAELPIFVRPDAGTMHVVRGRGLIASAKTIREEPARFIAAIAAVFGAAGADPERLWSQKRVDDWSVSSARAPSGFTDEELALLRSGIEALPADVNMELPCPAVDRHLLEVPDDQLWWANGDLTFARRLWRVNFDRYRLASGDLDRDGRSDIVFHQPGPRDDPIWLFAAGRAYKNRYFKVNGVYQPHAGDFDGDGFTDLLWHDPEKNSAAIWWMKEELEHEVETIDAPPNARALVRDFDGDGYADLIWWTADLAPRVVWFSGRRERIAEEIPRKASGSPILGDFDGDGAADIFWYQSNVVKKEEIWWGTKQRRFLAMTEHVQVSNGLGACAGDFDGDGRDDILWNRPGKTRDAVWLSTSDRRFDHHDITVWIDLSCVTGDFDGDGRDDIFWYERAASP